MVEMRYILREIRAVYIDLFVRANFIILLLLHYNY